MAKRRRRRSPDQAANNWVNAMQSTATQTAYKNGTQGKGSQAMQMALEALNSGKYLAGVQRAINNNSMSNALVDPMAQQLYNTNTQSVGAANLGPGAMKKKAKYQARIQGLQTTYDQMHAAAVAVDPTESINTASQRSAAALQVLINAGKRGGARP